jgi:hypothetical protein
VDLWKKDRFKWYQTPTPIFTESQVKPLKAETEVIEKAEAEVKTEVKPEVIVKPEETFKKDLFSFQGSTFQMTVNDGNVKATFNAEGLNRLTKPDFEKFKKYYVDQSDRKSEIIDYLSDYLSEEKKIILTGKKYKSSNEIAKAVKVIGKAERVHYMVADGYAYLSDSYALLKCAENELTQFINSKPTYYVNDHFFKNEHLKDLLEKITSSETVNVDYSKALTETTKIGKKNVKFYHPEGSDAVNKTYIDCFKNKLYSSSGKYKPVFQKTENYTYAICPMKVS